MVDRSSRRAYSKIGTFELAHLVRNHGLTPFAGWLLLMLTVQCDFMTRRWRGTALELARDTGMNRATVTRTLAVLETAGLVKTETPFNRGGTAEIIVLAYDQLIVPSERQPHPSLDASIGQSRKSASLATKRQVSDPSMRKNEHRPMSKTRHATDMQSTWHNCSRCDAEADRTIDGVLYCWRCEPF